MSNLWVIAVRSAGRRRRYGLGSAGVAAAARAAAAANVSASAPSDAPSVLFFLPVLSGWLRFELSR
jgi:hypothetical protein